MMKLILFVAFALAGQLVKGANLPDPVGTVTCKNDHTVDISIANVDDLGGWITSDWRLENSADCEPTFSDSTVTYTDLVLPNCSMSSEQFNDSIKYTLKIKATRSSPAQLRVYDHLYYVTCDYDNQNFSTASFVPIKNRNDNDSSNSFFTFTLNAYYYSNFTGMVPNEIALNKTLYFKAEVVTQSADHNLDLFPVHCWSSESENPAVYHANDFTLIKDGCGNNTVSKDKDDTLSYACTNNSKEETFSLRTYRYYGADANAAVYIHCDLRVCLLDLASSDCECPSIAECDPYARKRRSVDDHYEFQVTAGPFYFENDEDEVKEEAEEKGEEAEEDEQDQPQPFSTNLAVIVAVSGVVVIAAMVCVTAYILMRNRKRSGSQESDLNVVS